MKYLGTDQSDIVKTLKNAEDFIRALNLGPETEQALDSRLARGAYTKIENAQSEASLSDAIRESGLTEQYRRMSDIFRYHAATEKDGKIQTLFNDLAAFGTFNGMTTHEYRASDAEEQLYLMTRYAEHHAKSGNQSVLQTVIDGFAERNKDRDYTDIQKTLSSFVTAARTGNNTELSNVFNQMDLHERHIITSALQHAAGLDSAMQAVRAKGPHQAYGIAFTNLPRNFEQQRTVLEPILNKIEPVIEKYAKTGDVEMGVMLGIIRQKDPNKKLSGLSFFVTPRVAQEIARALPNHTLIDYEGNQVISKQAIKAPPPKR